MRVRSLLSVLVLALCSAAVPAGAQFSGPSGMPPGRLVDRLVTLPRPIDVALQGVSVRQAAQAVSEASGVPVHVDPQVPDASRVTLTARHAPLAMVLEAIARQADLFIAPQPHSVLLVPTPSLTGPGGPASLAAPFAPWTNEWGLYPAANPYSARS
jgi:type II secretory pathway component GspD/PulD (secretin)